MINFGHETEELEFKRSTGEVHDAMKDVVAILNKHEKRYSLFRRGSKRGRKRIAGCGIYFTRRITSRI